MVVGVCLQPIPPAAQEAAATWGLVSLEDSANSKPIKTIYKALSRGHMDIKTMQKRYITTVWKGLFISEQQSDYR